MNAYIAPGVKTEEEIIAESFGITPGMLMKKTHERKIVDARNFLFWWKLNKKEWTNGRASHHYGWHHSSVNHAEKAVNSLWEADKLFREKAERAMEQLKRLEEVMT